mgnify:CR=1 FL=1
MSVGKKGAGSTGHALLAPGDVLRRWWADRTRVQKWGAGLLAFGALALLPLYTPHFLDTPGISFGGTMAQLFRFLGVSSVAVDTNQTVKMGALKIRDSIKNADYEESSHVMKTSSTATPPSSSTAATQQEVKALMNKAWQKGKGAGKKAG